MVKDEDFSLFTPNGRLNGEAIVSFAAMVPRPTRNSDLCRASLDTNRLRLSSPARPIPTSSASHIGMEEEAVALQQKSEGPSALQPGCMSTSLRSAPQELKIVSSDAFTIKVGPDVSA